MSNFYEILGVSQTASFEEIKSSYRKLAVKHHPDKNHHNEADDQKIKQINEAYDTLKDADKRATYDMSLQMGNNFQGSPFGNGQSYYHRRHPNLDDETIFNIFRHVHPQNGQQQGDPFSSFFNFNPNYNPQANKPTNKHLAMTLNISLLDAFTGTEKIISYKEGNDVRTVSVKIPAGVRSGMSLRLSGKAPKQFHDAPAGDIIVHLNLIAESSYDLVRDDLHANIDVPLFHTLTGEKTVYTNIDGELIDFEVPKNIRHSEFIKFSGKGMTIINSDKRGDLFLHVNVVMPELTDIQLTKIQKLTDTSKKHRK